MTQDLALKILKSGVNVYLTGCAGSGKTYVLNKYIQYLRDHDIDVAVTASTGIAATHMNGQTIHGFAGIGIKDYFSDYDYEALLDKQYLYNRFKRTKVLIIDEVSMLHGFRLDIVDRVCKTFKGNHLPFGGMQVVLSGDFFQLPPISRNTTDIKNDSNHMIVFSSAWKSMKSAICYLTEQHRQEDDEFTEILNKIRENKLTESHFAKIESRLNVINQGNHTKLYTHNIDVDDINARELAKIAGNVFEYEMTDKGKDNLVEMLKKSCIAPQTLKLKIGAEVMFIKNSFEKGYVNGTRGKIIGLSASKLPIVKCLNGKTIEVASESWRIEDDGKVKAEVNQIPLRLAWAITIHKSQGMSLDSAEIDLSKSFSYGMGYVALSRVKKLSGVKLAGFMRESLEVDPVVLRLDKDLRDESIDNQNLFGKLNDKELEKLHESFIVKVGGSIQQIKQSKNKKNKSKVSTNLETKCMLDEGLTISEIAKARKLTVGTIIGHIEDMAKLGEDMKYKQIKPSKILIDFVKRLAKGSEGKLTPIKDALDKEGYDYTFDEIKIAKLFI